MNTGGKMPIGFHDSNNFNKFRLELTNRVLI